MINARDTVLYDRDPAPRRFSSTVFSVPLKRSCIWV